MSSILSRPQCVNSPLANTVSQTGDSFALGLQHDVWKRFRHYCQFVMENHWYERISIFRSSSCLDSCPHYNDVLDRNNIISAVINWERDIIHAYTKWYYRK